MLHFKSFLSPPASVPLHSDWHFWIVWVTYQAFQDCWVGDGAEFFSAPPLCCLSSCQEGGPVGL